MNRKRIMALLLTSLLVTNLGTNMVMADINDIEYVRQYSQMYESEPIAEKLVAKSEITATATSAQSGEGADKAIDGNTSTLWHTPWTGVNIAENPQSITLSLGKVRNVSSIHITPRQSGSNGKIKDYKVYAGDNLIEEGTWKTDLATKYIILNEPIETDSIRVEAISTIGDTNNKYASIAEIDVYEADEAPSKFASAENLQINNGVGGDLSDHLEKVLNKEEGTAVIRFQSTNSGLQSLFSISNNTRANEHFHVYVNGGQVGYELRKQSGNVSTGVISKSLNKGINTIAFRAEKNSGYSIYLNGEKILNNNVDTANFLASLEGANTFKLGTTDRSAGSNEYNFTGKIDFFEFYDRPLVDRYLTEITGQTATQALPLPEGAIKTDPVDVFTPGELGSNNFRIPSLFTTKEGTLIAGIDARIGGGHDSPNNIDSGVKRSTDNGKTWDSGQVVLNYPDNASGIDTAILQDESTGEIFMLVDAFPHGGGTWQAQRGSGFSDIEVNGETVRAMNLTHTNGSKYYAIPGDEGSEFGNVIDSEGNLTSYKVDVENNLYKYNVKIGNTFGASSELKAYMTSYLALVSSKDDGVTWSKPKIISGQFKKEWMSFLGTGPGRGYQIKNGENAGRLIFPVYSLNRNQKQSSAVIYSDDQGNTWEIGESVNDNRLVNGITIQGETFTGVSGEEMTEAQVVEMPNGELKMFMRNPSRGNPAVATSKDGGETWEDIIDYELDLKEPYCQLSVINYEGEIDGKPAVIFANPNSSTRAEGTVQIGLINNVGTEENPVWDFEWKYKQLVKPGYYAYSCLSQLENGNIGLFYEGTPTEEMSFTEMNIEYLKADLLADAPAAILKSITSIDNVKRYTPGDTFNFKVTFDQTVSLIGDRNLTLIINGKEVSSSATRISGNEYKLTGVLPEDIGVGTHKISVKAKSGLEVINSIGKVMDLSNNIETESTIIVEDKAVEEKVKFTLNGEESIKAGENLDVKLALSDIGESEEVFAVDANLTYDATKFELGEGSITAIDGEKTSVSYKEIEPGKVRIIIASLGTPIVSAEEIVNISLKAKDTIGLTDIGISGTYADGMGSNKEIVASSISVDIKENIVVDTSKLEILISEGEMLEEESYTQGTWANFIEAFNGAKLVINKADVTQEEVDTAASLLEKAIAGLERVEQESIFTKHLEIAIEMAEDITEEDLTDVIPVVKKEFKEALIEAKDIMTKLEAGNDITQEVVNKSFDRLAKAMHSLEFKGNKTELLALVETIKGLNAKDFTRESFKVLQDVLNSKDVQDVINDENALEADITKAYNALYDAFTKLEVELVNKDMLNSLIVKIEKLTENEYIPSTWENLQGVLEISRGVTANNEATQAEVDEAYFNLLRAYLDLRIKPSKDKLEDLINKAEQLDSSKYTKSSWKALGGAVKSAKSVFKNEEATKVQIEEAEKGIEIAIANLEPKEIASSGNNGIGEDNDNGSGTGDNNNNGSGNGSNNGNNSGETGSNNGNKGSGTGSLGHNQKLPNTGGVPSAAIGLFGTVLALVGGFFVKKKDGHQ
ncbi:LPXTG cell wall anchor domain-containing protein [Clostridium sartagoforme]|uniref:exo-alpha-sialidase n=1 Tax=Clostridium sartagoforme TaxID=84031 RepID=A0A4S2DNJ2_9CLOT|nr:sialidase domain-containing protein [Clostridium sartagoforme]TGY43352.1 LPXTG cell wall anchor domain-containing protein [Clostridium sartagoforme]